MFTTRVRHAPSTNYDEGQPPKKRLKGSGNTASSVTVQSTSDDDDESVSHESQMRESREIPDSEEDVEDGNDDEDEDEGRQARKPAHLTELEAALPFVKTDEAAIADYESQRAAEPPSTELDRDSRLGQREWIKGKSSIYVDAFNLALETVLEDERHLFDEAEIAVFEHWRLLNYEAQYLYVRLFLRKTSTWHRIRKLRYYSDIADLIVAAATLQGNLDLPASTSEVQVNPGELESPPGTTLGTCLTFADTSDGTITSLEEASSLLTLDELKILAKDAKVQGKNKGELLRALRRSSGKQGGLSSFAGLRRSGTDDSTLSIASPVGTDAPMAPDPSCSPDQLTVSRDAHFISTILSLTGPLIRLSHPSLTLFERVHLVFYRSTEWTEKSLTTIILARISRRNFASYIVSRSTNIFPSRSILLEFEAAIRTQFRVDSILEFSGNHTRIGYETVLTIFESVLPRWRTLIRLELDKEHRVYESGEGAYLRRFSPAWVYTRIVHKALSVLARYKEHQREHGLLTELLAQHLFHASRRGAWYQRRALLEEHYMHLLSPVPHLTTDDAQRKYFKRIALQTCEQGLRDSSCHHIYHYDLQKRILKLERSLKVPKREQHDFGHVQLAKPLERVVQGIQVSRIRTLPHRRRSSGDLAGTGSKGAKTIWLDEREGGGECSVEDMCLSWYRDQGWKGYHSEGGIVRTLFGYLFCDILYLYVPNVFQTAFQTAPLDLHTDAFYLARQSEIARRLVQISNGGAADIVRAVWEEHFESQTCIVGVDWGFVRDDLLEMVSCFDSEALATICKVMAQDYRHRGGGIPDLFLWSPEKGQHGKGEVRFVEVKSENDRLSDTQRLWIHVLMGVGVPVELCAAVAKEVRVV